MRRVLLIAAALAAPCLAADARQSIEVTFVATPSAGLTSGDLKLTVDGKDQPIAGVEKIAAGKTASNLPPRTFSNHTGAERTQDASVILVDGVNTDWRNDASARDELTRALGRIGPEERAAILILGKNLKLLSDFSDSSADRAAKVAALAYSDLIRPINLTSRAEMYQEQQRLTDTYSNLRAIAGMLKAVPGRKNLLWISADFPLLLGRPDEGNLHPSDADSDVQRTAKLGYNKDADDLIRTLNLAGVAVYPVDARRVSLDPLRRQSRVNSITTSGAGEAGTIDDIMKHLADQTGGAAFSGGKELGDSLRGALDDSQNAYVLTFTPAKWVEDGSPHKLKLQAKTKGTQIRIRPNYYAPSPAMAPGDPSPRLAMALSAPLDLPEIGLTVHLNPDPADAASLSVSLEIDSRTLQLTRQGENWIAVVGLGIVQGNAAGEQFGRQMQSGGITIPGADYAKAMRDGSGIHFDFKLKRDPKASFLRFGVIDQKTPKSGSLSVSL